MSHIVENMESQMFDKVDKNTTQELNDLKEILRIAHNKYLKNLLLYDAIKEYVNDDKSEDELRMKVQNMLLEEDCEQVLHLNNTNFSSSSLLGLPPKTQTELSYVEGKTLQAIISYDLKEKQNSMSKSFAEITSQNIDQVENRTSLDLKLSTDEQILLDFKNSLIAQQKCYLENLGTLQDLLEEIAELRLAVLPCVSQEKVKESQTKTNLNLLKARITQDKAKVEIFTENHCSLNAYKEIIKDIKDQQKNCARDIEHLKEMKEKYKQVSCKHFDDILKSYIHYKSAIEKKKLLLESIK